MDSGQMFVGKKSITFWWSVLGIKNYVSTWYKQPPPFLTSVPAGNWDQRPLTIIPVNANDPSAGYVLGDLDWYVSTKTILHPYKGEPDLLLTQSWDEAAILLPVLDEGGATFYLKQHPSQGDGVLTLDTRGYVVCFEPYQAQNDIPIIQHFSFTLYDDDTQYFWIRSTATGNALAANSAAAGAAVQAVTPAVDSSQLWGFNPGVPSIANKLNDFLLDINGGSGGSLCINPPQQQKQSQGWGIDEDGYMTCTEDNLVATLGSDNTQVTASPKGAAGDENQLWFLDPYIPHPDTSQNQFNNLSPGATFTLNMQNESNQVLVVTGAEGSPLALEPDSDAPTLNKVWMYKNGLIINMETNLVIDVSGNQVIANNPSGLPSQNWQLTGDGYFINQQSSQVVTLDGSSVAMEPYNALRPGNQNWYFQLIPWSPPESYEKKDLAEAVIKKVGGPVVPHPLANITSLQVQITISNDWWSGTDDSIYLSLGYGGSGWIKVFDAPSRGDKATVTINLQQTFGQSSINLNDITHISLYQSQIPHPIMSDDCKIGSILLIANGQYTNYTFQNLNTWLDAHLSDSEYYPTWMGAVSWAQWLDSNQKPIDMDLETYPVTLIPWIGDIRSWRTYDPSTIDGVGQLVGMRNGRLIGEQLKTRQCEELDVSDSTHSYTWVYTPTGAIIYKLWNKAEDRNNYIRHSQLGSGQPVICAGELDVQVQQQSPYDVPLYVIGMVNDASGHYKPDGGKCLWNFAQKLQSMGIPTDSIQWYWTKKNT